MALVCRSLVRPRKEAISLLSSSVATQRLFTIFSRSTGLHRDRKSARKCLGHLPAAPSCPLSTGSSTVSDVSIPLSPAVRYHVDTNKIFDISVIPATGPSNRLLKGDVLQYLDDLKAGKVVATTTKPTSQVFKPIMPVQKTPQVTQAPPRVRHQPLKSSSYVDIPVDETRRVAAEREVYSKWSTPYSYATATCSMDRVLETVRKIESEGSSKLSMNDFIIRAVAQTLQDIPESNGVWSGEGVRLLSSVDISVSVSGEEGVYSGVVRGVNRLSVDEISAAVKSLPSQSTMTGQRSFSITSLSLSGVTEFTSILPPQHSAILSVGSLHTAPSSNKNTVSHFIIVTLTSDPRVLHYALACRWLETFKRSLELAV